MKRPRNAPGPRARAAPAALSVLLLLLAGCAAPPEDCTDLHVFEWDAPGLYDALADPADWPVTNATAGPGIPPPEDAGFDRYGAPRVATVRYSDPDAPLRHASAHFGDPGVKARLVITVPNHDDRPEPLFDALWEGLGFGGDRAAVRADLLATRGDTGHLISYQAEVEPDVNLASWLEARGGLDAADEDTPQLAVVQLLWESWRMDARTPWRAWTYGDGQPPHRLQAMPHGHAMLLVDAALGWSPEQAAQWMRDHAEQHILPTEGLDGVSRGPIERVCA